MKPWTEFHIGVVYFTALFIALLTSAVTLLYLRPIKSTLKKISGRFATVSSRSFKTTIILAGLLGAMSVTFRDCEGRYDYLINSPERTIAKGLDQVASCFNNLSLFLGLWLIIFLLLLLTKKKMPNT